MTIRRWATTFIVACSVMSQVVARATNPTAPIPWDYVHSLVVDDAREQIFVSSGGVSDPSGIVVFGFDGTVVDTIDMPNAAGMVLHEGVLYVAKQGLPTIAKVDPASLAVTDEIALPQANNGTLALADGRLWYVDGQCCPSGDLASLDLATEQSTLFDGSRRWSSPTLEAVPGRPELLLVRDGVDLSRVDLSTTPPTPLPPEIEVGHGMAIPPGEGTVLGLDMREIDLDTFEETGFKYEGETFTQPIAAGAGGVVAGSSSYNGGEQVLIYGPSSPAPTKSFPVLGGWLDAEFDAAATKLFVATQTTSLELQLEVLDLTKQNLDLTLETPQSIVDHGSSFTLTAQLEHPEDLEEETLTLMRGKDYETPSQIATAEVNAEGVATFMLEADESSYFFVRFEGDDRYIGGTSDTVPVKVRTVATAALKGHYGESKGMKLYRSGDVVKVRGASHPVYADCNFAFYLQRYLEADDKWQYVTSVPACRDDEGKATWLRPINKPGVYRVRTSLALNYYVKGYSDWLLLKVKP